MILKTVFHFLKPRRLVKKQFSEALSYKIKVIVVKDVMPVCQFPPV